jgi:N6-L-threonylcarbamoyladenine synthase
MPVFQVGTAFAKTLALALQVPLYTTTHQKGHLAAALFGNESLCPPYTFIHLSGGTTDFISVDTQGNLQTFAFSQDLHVGQVVDRVGVALSLPFPSGVHLEKLTEGYQATGKYSSIVQNGNCCFSGVEAQAMRDIKQGKMEAGQVAIEVYDVIARSIFKVLNYHFLPSSRVLVAGGVASSSLLRDMLQKRIQAKRLPFQFYFGKPSLSGDNAAGVARIGQKIWEASK